MTAHVQNVTQSATKTRNAYRVITCVTCVCSKNETGASSGVLRAPMGVLSCCRNDALLDAKYLHRVRMKLRVYGAKYFLPVETHRQASCLDALRRFVSGTANNTRLRANDR